MSSPRTPQVSWQLAVYTSPCTQPIAPLCDRFTPYTVQLLSTLPQTLISAYQPIKGITNENRNLKTNESNSCCKTTYSINRKQIVVRVIIPKVIITSNLS